MSKAKSLTDLFHSCMEFPCVYLVSTWVRVALFFNGKCNKKLKEQEMGRGKKTKKIEKQKPTIRGGNQKKYKGDKENISERGRDR